MSGYGRAPGSGLRRSGALLACTALATLLAGGCINPGGRYWNPGEDGGRTGLASKVVMRKVAPNYLVAMDRTTCEVSADRFREVRTGQRVLCDWKSGRSVAGGDRSRGPSQPGREPAGTPRVGVPRWPGG
jgi:hypothetical protein